MNDVEKNKLKNENRKAGRASVGSGEFRAARYKRRVGFIGKDGECVNGAFGKVQAGSYNELIVGTSGVPQDLGEQDLFDAES